MVSHWGLSNSYSLEIFFWAYESILRMLWSQSFLLYPFLQSFPQDFWKCSKYINYNYYHRHLHISLFFQHSGKIKVFVNLFPFFQLLLLLAGSCSLGFEWRQVSRILHQILSDLNNFKFFKSLGTVPSEPTTISIIATLILQRLFSSLASSEYSSFQFLLFLLSSTPERQNQQVLFLVN